ncbi:MAG: dodecin family protein [Hyphomicrobiales bacterium]
MATLKVIELMEDSSKSWEDAVQQAVKRASKSVDNIRSAWVKEHSCVVDGDEITSYRVTIKLTFEVKD